MLFTFRSKNVNDEVEKDEPFVSEESLQEYCSLFSADGIPNNIREDPYLAEIIKLSYEDLDNIAQVIVIEEISTTMIIVNLIPLSY